MGLRTVEARSWRCAYQNGTGVVRGPGVVSDAYGRPRPENLVPAGLPSHTFHRTPGLHAGTSPVASRQGPGSVLGRSLMSTTADIDGHLVPEAFDAGRSPRV